VVEEPEDGRAVRSGRVGVSRQIHELLSYPYPFPSLELCAKDWAFFYFA
jgi:hypothetical protein